MPVERRERDADSAADGATAGSVVPMSSAAATAPAFEPACTFPYKLDVFQQRSIEILEAGESVMVSAHTSAGKTTVAIYAIARALKQRKRVIYTSPIKALSNQKFKELTDRFDSVGLMTGDTTIKPDADCLVMTTEILRSMLYRGTEMLREVGCVIFDEVHYMRDKARGVVWEETIIMLPEMCQCVFLSATIPNAAQFAAWFEKIHPTAKCHVVHTDYRPVPLQHYLFPIGASGIFLTIDEQSKFREDSFKQAMQLVRPGGGEGGGAGGAAVGGEDGGGGDGPSKGNSRHKRQNEQAQVRSGVMNIVQLVMERDMYPAIVFCFAKTECEKNAMTLAKINFNSKEEEDQVAEVYQNAIESLSEDDRGLPAVEHLLPLLRRGVGIHHSGLLPILKEVVELLFGAGLVKCLFSTETFSMGLNMPARTVIFTGVKKFDGSENRLLTGGEYIQMSGRAGRRGLDRVGIVISMIDSSVDPDKLREMMSGGADVLNSSFHLTYNMVLNLLRVEDADPQFIMVRSFSQFQREGKRPQLEAQTAALRKKLAGLSVSDEHAEIIEEFVNCQAQIASMRRQLRALIHQPRYLISFLTGGRPIHIVRSADGVDFGWGVCTGGYRCLKGAGHAADEAMLSDASEWTVDVACLCFKREASLTSAAQSATPCSLKDYASDVAELATLTFSLLDVHEVSRMRMTLPDQPFTSADGKQRIVQTIAAMSRQYNDQLPALTAKELGASGTMAAAAAASTATGSAADRAKQQQHALEQQSSAYDKLSARIDRLQKQFDANELRVALVARDAAVAKAAAGANQRRRRAGARGGGGGDDDDDHDGSDDEGKDDDDDNNTDAAADAADAADVDAPTAALLAAHTTYLKRREIVAEVALIQGSIEAMQEAVLQDELKKMIRVMRRMDYLDRDNILMRKGRVACEITTSDENELLLTELLFRGTLNNMETEMVVALLSCLVNVSKQPDGFKLAEEFQWPLQELRDIVKRIAAVSLESGLTFSGALLDVDATSKADAAAATEAAGGGGRNQKSVVDEKVQPSLMEVTYRWAKGAKFIEVIGLTQAYEGDIVRMMRRLEELLRQMATAAKSPAVGSPELHDKFMAGIAMIKRDIVFASSLYL